MRGRRRRASVFVGWALFASLAASAAERTPSVWETLQDIAEERGSVLSRTQTFAELRDALGERPQGAVVDEVSGQRGIRFSARSGDRVLEFRFVPEIPGVQGEQFYLIERRGGSIAPSILRRSEDGDGFVVWKNARDPKPRRVRLGREEGALTASIQEEQLTELVSHAPDEDPFKDAFPPPPAGLPFPDSAPAAVTLPDTGRLVRAVGSLYDPQTGQNRPYASYRDESGNERAFRVRYGDDFAIQTPGGALFTLEGRPLGPAGAFSARCIDGVPRYLASRGWSAGRSRYVDVAGREYEGEAQLQFVQTGRTCRGRACGYWQQTETIRPVAAAASSTPYFQDPDPAPPLRSSDSTVGSDSTPLAVPSRHESRPLWIAARTYSGRAAFRVDDAGQTLAYFGTRRDGSGDWRPVEGARTYYYAAGGLYDREGRRLGDFAVSPETAETGDVFLGTAGTLRWPDGRAYHFDGWNHLDGFGRTFIVRGPPPGFEASFSEPGARTVYERGEDGVYRGQGSRGWMPGLRRAGEGRAPAYVVRGDRVFRLLAANELEPAAEFEGHSFVNDAITSGDGSLRIRRTPDGFSVQRRAFVRMNWVRSGPRGTMLEDSYRCAWMADPGTRVRLESAEPGLVLDPVSPPRRSSGSLLPAAPAASPSLDEIIAGFLDESPGTHSVASHALSMHPDKAGAVSRLISFLRAHPEAHGARRAAVILGEIAPPGDEHLLTLSLEFLDGLEDPKGQVRARTQEFLSALGPAGLYAVRVALKNDGRSAGAEQRRRLAAVFVGRAEVRDLPTLAPLTALLHDRNYASAAARAEAARALGRLGPEAAAAAIPSLLASAIHSGEEEEVRRAAEQAVSALAPRLAADRRRALEEHARGIYIGTGHYSERYEAALALAEAGYMDERMLSVLYFTLHGRSSGASLAQRRAAAAAYAGVIRNHARDASLDQLESLLEAAFAPGQDSQIRETCRAALTAAAPNLIAAADADGIDAARRLLNSGGAYSGRPSRWS